MEIGAGMNTIRNRRRAGKKKVGKHWKWALLTPKFRVKKATLCTHKSQLEKCSQRHL